MRISGGKWHNMTTLSLEVLHSRWGALIVPSDLSTLHIMLVILLARGLSKQSLVILVLASRSYKTDNVQFVAQNMTFKHSLLRSNTFLTSLGDSCCGTS
jgi:hypothetical protein